MARLRVLLAEDDPSVRVALRRLLSVHFDVVAVVGDGAALIEATRIYSPDVIVTDVGLPGVDGLTAAAQIRDTDPQARIVVISGLDDASMADRAQAAGALAYIPQLLTADELEPAVRAAWRGERYFPRTS